MLAPRNAKRYFLLVVAPPPWFLLTHKALVPLTAGLVLAYLALHLLLGRLQPAASRSLGAMLLASAANMLAAALWYGGYRPEASLFGLGVALSLRYVILYWLADFAYRFVEDDRPRERRLVTGLLLVITLPFALTVLSRLAEPMAIYNFGQLAHSPDAPSTFTVRMREVFSPGIARTVFVVAYAWSMSVLVRKCIRIERAHGGGAWRALFVPRSGDARALRDFGALTLGLLGLEVLQGLGVIQSTSVWLLMLSCAVIWVHVNHSRQPTKLRFKLVSIPFAVVVGLLGATFRGMVEDSWAHGNEHLAERADEVHRRVERSSSAVGPDLRLDADPLPAEVLFVLHRPGPVGAYSPAWRGIRAVEGIDVARLNEIEAEEEAWRVGVLALSVGAAPGGSPERMTEALSDLRSDPRLRWSRIKDGPWMIGVRAPAHERYIAWARESERGVVLVGFSELARRVPTAAVAGRFVLVIGVVGAALLIGLPLLFRRSVLLPIERLLGGVRRVEQGDLTARVDSPGNDEFGTLSASFDRMVESVAVAHETLERINRAAFRFVPLSFLRTLDHESIVGVRLGDQTRRMMTVLFADVRGFTSLCERMTPDETFAFVNALLARLGPVVRRHGGFVDKYLGDAIMALFAGGPEHALAAAVEMRGVLAEFNAERATAGEPPVRIGIGLHHGDLILGIIGEEERIEGTVLADTVNIASRLEGLNKRYGASIIIAAEFLAALPPDSAIEFRRVERVRILGRETPLTVCEVFSGDPEQLAASKRRTRTALEDALGAFDEWDFPRALELFEALGRGAPEDPVIRLHHDRARRFVEHGPPSDWDGAHRMDGK